jgi:hypothetical protein
VDSPTGIADFRDPGRILNLLHADSRKARRRLDILLQRLVKFLQWRRTPQPARCLSETCRAVEASLDEGTEMIAAESFFLARARQVADSRITQARRPSWSQKDEARPVADPDPDRIRNALRASLADLTPANREIALGYFHRDRRTRETTRRDLARRLALDDAELRDHALDLRAGLERDVAKRIG